MEKGSECAILVDDAGTLLIAKPDLSASIGREPAF
jgi:hypothetical protein